MAPIGYSKWGNIDTDSEPEDAQQQPPVLRGNPPADASIPQSTPSPLTGEQDVPGPIHAVIVRCDVEKRTFLPWSAKMISKHHPVFSQAVPNIPRLIGVPLVIYREGTQSMNRVDLDNQVATYLNIDAESGFAAPEWRSHVGTVVVARKDKKPLLLHHLEGV
ncbi:hypothetical protein QQZ08_012162 [Neonectria magnoliae]|uniref:Uncharacterized protein n=1 Tax=Neonectria magnoliae TaxID=2732573 RepID=A0ABR1H4F0_9HYPO